MDENLQIALAASTWCAAVQLLGREHMADVEAPLWVKGWSDPVSLAHTVAVEWLGRSLRVSGVHVGPPEVDDNWFHSDMGLEMHWNLRWSVADPGCGKDGRPIPAEILKRLPSSLAWEKIGAWLLGGQLALCNLEETGAHRPERESTNGAGWELLLRGFHDSVIPGAEAAFRTDEGEIS